MSLRRWHGTRGGRQLRAISWLSALALLAVVAPGAHAAWTAPINVSAPGQGALQPQVAAGETGAVFAWQLAGQQGTAQTRARSWPGALSSIQELSVYGGGLRQVSFEPDVAVDDSGAAVYGWAQYTEAGGGQPQVQGRARSAAGVLGPILDLSPILGGVDNVHVDVDSEGDAVAVWEVDMGSFHQVQARAWTAAGVLGPLLELSPPGQDATRPQVAVGAGGEALFAWQRLDGTSYRAEARALTAAGVLEPTVVLSSTRWTSVTPQVAVDPSGNALFVWRSSDPGGAGSGRIETRARLTDGTFTRRQTVADAPGDADNPQVAVAAHGAGLFAWRRSRGPRMWLKVRPRSALGGLGSERTVAVVASPQFLTPPQLSLDSEGDAVIAWGLYDATGTMPACCNLAQARTLSPAGHFQPVETLSGPGATSVGVASDASGDAVVVWTRANGSAGRIQAAAGP